MRSSVRLDSRRARILDPHLLPEQGDFLVCPIELSLQPETAVGAIGRPTAGVDGGILGQGDDVQYGRPNVPLPVLGKRDLGRFLVRRHDSSAWLQMLS